MLDDLATVSALESAIRDCVARAEPGAWIRGSGWALPLFPNAHPRRALLDALAPENPVYLVAADGHSAWVNTRTLELAGIDRHTPDPPGGRIEREPTGHPTGTLREAAAGLVATRLPAHSSEEWEAGITAALEMASRYGITAMHEAGIGVEALRAYAALDADGRLNARIVGAFYADPGKGPAQVDSLVALRARHPPTPFFRMEAVKIMADGVIESGTAALLEPYAGTDHRGSALFRAGQLDTLAAALDAAGFQIHVHAIGDRAIRMSLDALAFARGQNGPRDARPILAHIQLFDPSDLPRFPELGVVGSFQPLWAYADAYITDLTEPVLGPERSRWLYPIASLVETGAVVAGGSDWNVSSMNPLDAIQVGITRRALDDSTGTAWLPDERVDLTTMLRLYTINAAYAAGDEANAGTLEAGKVADLVVLERDLYETPPAHLHAVPVTLTVVDGRIVYSILPQHRP
jgi:hypothetical protein